MKSIKGFAAGLFLGLAVAIGTVGLAQDTKPTGQTQNAESCCAACCCHGDSCSMHNGNKGHTQAQIKHDPVKMKAHPAEGGCSCCGGDSCEMQMKKQEQEKQKQ